MIVTITEAVFNSILEHATTAVPVEACGYLAGKDGVITKAYPMLNADNSATHFSFIPENQFEVLHNAITNGLELMGNYHSHIFSMAYPSKEDVRLAADPNALYFIISLVCSKKPQLNVFTIRNGNVRKHSLNIVM